MGFESGFVTWTLDTFMRAFFINYKSNCEMRANTN